MQGFLPDRDGGLWLSLVDGLARVQWPTAFTYFQRANGFDPGFVRSMLWHDGTLYLFQVASEEGRWLVKVRVSYPKAERNGEQWAEEVLGGYAKVPDTKVEPKVPLVEEKVPEKK